MFFVSLYGVQPFGSTVYGGAGLITVLGVLPLSNNSWIVVFDIPPKADDPESPTSATNPSNYILTAVDPTYISATVPAPGILAPTLVAPTRFPFTKSAIQDEEDLTQIILYSESFLEPGITYTVTISDTIVGQDCETFTGPTEFTFTAPLFSKVPVGVQIIEQRYRDLDYKNYGEDGFQAFGFDDSNDIGIQDAISSLRKRIKRRVFSQKGSFVWAPDYGVGIKTKALIRSGRLQQLANLINEQIKLEPDVIDCSTTVNTVNTTGGTFIEINVSVFMRDARTLRVVFRDQV